MKSEKQHLKALYGKLVQDLELPLKLHIFFFRFFYSTEFSAISTRSEHQKGCDHVQKTKKEEDFSTAHLSLLHH